MTEIVQKYEKMNFALIAVGMILTAVFGEQGIKRKGKCSMKKRFATMLSVIFVMFIASVSASAKINVRLDAKPLEFDVEPVIINSRTMVPMRGIFEALGANVSWDDTTKTVTAVKGSDVIKTTIGSNIINVNSENIKIDAPSQIKDSRTLVPVRFISESLGYTVKWNETTSTVIILSRGELEVHFIDVGQADCALIIQGDDAMLVDGGNKADGPLILNYIKEQGVDDLDYVICTHGHEDHVGGLAYVIENVKTDIVIADNNYDSATFKNFISTVLNSGIDLKEPNVGETFSIGNSSVTITAPVSDYYSDYNDNSIVFRLAFGDNSFLFTGDAGERAEADILASNAYLYSDVLKTGHHGSRTATSIPFIFAVAPKYAVISCGAGNSYGHPHAETLTTFKRYGVQYFRTDEVGNIVAKSDGQSLTFSKTPKSAADFVSKPTQAVEVKEEQVVSGSYIGNKNTKKIHLASCRSLPAEKNRVYFNSVSDAVKQGYTACKNCKP